MTLGRRLFIHALFFLSGATALVYQVTWTRSFSLIFGATHQAISVVLAAFMAGLALGALYFGRRSRMIARPLRLYGFLEIGIAAAALLVPAFLEILDRVYVALALRAEGYGALLTLVRSMFAFAVLIVPTFLMGGTLPLLVRFLVRDRNEFGKRLAGLYGTNAVGAVAGVVSSGFLLLPGLGVWWTQIAAVVANVLIGSVAVLADRRLAVELAPDAMPLEEAGATAVPAPSGAAGSAIPLAVRLAYLGAGVSGFCALALEVLWTRAISISTGLSTYSFTVMLAAFLIGIALGSWLHAVVPLRRVAGTAQFGTVLVLIGFTSLAVSQIVPRLPQLAMGLSARPDADLAVRAGTTLLVSLAVMLVPATLMGVAFPLAGEARARMRQAVGKSVGDVFGWNTFGAILGSLAAGFILIPALGLQQGMHAVSVLYAAYGIVVLGAWAYPRRVTSKVAATALVVGLIASVALAIAQIPRWDVRIMGAFSHNSPGLYGSAGDISVERGLADARVLYYEEGRGSTVSVYERLGVRSMQVDGKTLASDGLGDLHVELLLGHVPALVHPEPRSAAVIGLGAGITLGAVASHDSIERLVLVEIEPAVYGAADQFKDVHGDALRRDGLEIVYQDGRNYMLTTRERFDVITADPIHPWVRGAAYLFTTEYYALLADHLTPRGVMCQWLPIYELSAENVKSVLGTFARNFEHTSLWLATNDIVLIGSDAPIEIDLGNVARRLAAPAVADQLRHVGLVSPLSFVAELTLDDAAVRKLAEGATINTDDNLYLEFSSPLFTSRNDYDISRMITWSQTVPVQLVSGFSPRFGPPEAEDEVLRLYHWAKRQTVEAARSYRQAAPAMIENRSDKNLELALKNLNEVRERLPEYEPARILYAEVMIGMSEALFRHGYPDAGFRMLGKALAVVPGYGRAHQRLGARLSSAGRREEALEHFRAVVNSRCLRYWEAYEGLGKALGALGRYREAVAALRRGLEVRPQHLGMKTVLGLLLATAPRDVRDAEEALRIASEALGESDRPEPAVLRAFAAALAASGDLAEAAEWAAEAEELALEQGKAELARALRKEARSYRGRAR